MLFRNQLLLQQSLYETFCLASISILKFNRDLLRKFRSNSKGALVFHFSTAFGWTFKIAKKNLISTVIMLLPSKGQAAKALVFIYSLHISHAAF